MRKGTFVVHHTKAHANAMAKAQSAGQHWQAGSGCRMMLCTQGCLNSWSHRAHNHSFREYFRALLHADNLPGDITSLFLLSKLHLSLKNPAVEVKELRPKHCTEHWNQHSPLPPHSMLRVSTEGPKLCADHCTLQCSQDPAAPNSHPALFSHYPKTEWVFTEQIPC